MSTTATRLLAIDTTEQACSAALCVDGAVSERFEIAPRRHSELILPMVDALLSAADFRLVDLDALAFARGPGSFTGVRIAASVIQGLAFAADLPVVAVSSLQALAQGAADRHGADAVLSALDARMNEVYYGAYVRDEAGVLQAVVAERVCAPGSVDAPDGHSWCGAGSGWAAHAEVLRARSGTIGDVYADDSIHAADVAVLALPALARGEAVAAERAMPVYLRDEVAWSKNSPKGSQT